MKPDLYTSTRILKGIILLILVSDKQMDIIEPVIRQIAWTEIFEMLIYIAGSLLSAILVVLSVVAYRKNRLKKLQYAAIAFSLFCVFLIYENLEHFFSLDNPFTDIIIPSSGLAIILFFFFAVTKKS